MKTEEVPTFSFLFDRGLKKYLTTLIHLADSRSFEGLSLAYSLLISCTILWEARRMFRVLTLQSNHCRVSARKFFFSESVIRPWNSLTTTLDDFRSLRSFNLFVC